MIREGNLAANNRCTQALSVTLVHYLGKWQFERVFKCCVFNCVSAQGFEIFSPVIMPSNYVKSVICSSSGCF